MAQARAATFELLMTNRPLAPTQRVLDAVTFEAWLGQNQLLEPHLRWYLDYCCRDDYGAGIDTVSAWAGIHYFASRHGFFAPQSVAERSAEEQSAVLTWPQGNAWLAQRLAAPLGERLLPRRVVVRIEALKHGVEVDALNPDTGQLERWQAQHCIVALPVFVAARVVQGAPELLRQRAARLRYAPWLVANLHLHEPLHDRPGVAPSWDNVLYGAKGLGYVDAQHQSLRPVPAATVLTYYRALGDQVDGRRQLLERPWASWRDEILAELSLAHPDLPAKTTQMDITRYGHAMAIPTPGTEGPASRVPQQLGRLSFAHSDWAGYSVFEEAFTQGHQAASLRL
jgi:monoamine oxidase